MESAHYIDDPVAGRQAVGHGGLFFGVYPALVVDIVDPENQGRVKVKLPWSPDPKSGGDGGYQVWARLATMAAGNQRGSWWIPDKDDEVLVSFQAGDPRHPFVVGMLWNGPDKPPETMDANGENQIKSFVTRNKVKIKMNDTNGEEELQLETPAGQKVVLSDKDKSIEIKDSHGNKIRLDSSGVTIDSTTGVTIRATSKVDVTAPAVDVTAAMSKFSGTVKADAVIT
ncbi:MAG: phage baseplate assembly protein V, partial [Verrucomicrobiota bacterium]